MKTINNDELKRDQIMEDIKNRKEYVKGMISYLDEWKDSDDIRKLLLKQIYLTNFSIKMIEFKLKVMDVIKGFKTKVTA